MRRLVTEKTLGVLRAEFERKKRAIKANWRALANRNDQFVLPRLIIDFLERTLKLKKEHWYDLCPLEPRWQSGHHFDVLTEPWPMAMLLCCPPDVLVDAVMGRAIIEYLTGQDIIFVAHENRLDGKLERTLLRKLGIRKHLGSPVLEPYKTHALGSYAIFLLLQPETLSRIQLFRSTREAAKEHKAEFDSATLAFSQSLLET